MTFSVIYDSRLFYICHTSYPFGWKMNRKRISVSGKIRRSLHFWEKRFFLRDVFRIRKEASKVYPCHLSRSDKYIPFYFTEKRALSLLLPRGTLMLARRDDDESACARQPQRLSRGSNRPKNDSPAAPPKRATQSWVIIIICIHFLIFFYYYKNWCV